MKKTFAFLASVAVLSTGLAAAPAAAQVEDVSTTTFGEDAAVRAAVLKWHEVMLETHKRSATPGEAPPQPVLRRSLGDVGQQKRRHCGN